MKNKLYQVVAWLLEDKLNILYQLYLPLKLKYRSSKPLSRINWTTIPKEQVYSYDIIEGI